MQILSGIDRNVALLALCQALMMTTTSAIIASGALIGQMLAEDKALATLPVALQFVATMLTAIPASLYMRRVGRRLGFVTGALIGVAGGTIATAAIAIASFWLFALGIALIGSLLAFGQFFRFAAADTAGPDMRSRAISLVLLGGVVAAFTGPNLARFTKDIFDPLAFAGTFAAIVLIYIADGAGGVAPHDPPDERGGQERAAAPAPGNPRPDQVHRGDSGRGIQLRRDDLRHDGDAARDGRLRFRLRRFGERDPVAYRRHVPAVLLYRPPRRALRRDQHHDRRRAAPGASAWRSTWPASTTSTS